MTFPDLPSNWLSAYSDAELCPAAFAGWSLAGVGRSQCQVFRVKRGISSNCFGGIGFENVGAKVQHRISRRRRGRPKVKPRGTCVCLSAPFLASATCLAVPGYPVLTAVFPGSSPLYAAGVFRLSGPTVAPERSSTGYRVFDPPVLPSIFSFPAAWPGSVPEGAAGALGVLQAVVRMPGGRRFLSGVSPLFHPGGVLYCHG